MIKMKKMSVVRIIIGLGFILIAYFGQNYFGNSIINTNIKVEKFTESEWNNSKPLKSSQKGKAEECLDKIGSKQIAVDAEKQVRIKFNIIDTDGRLLEGVKISLRHGPYLKKKLMYTDNNGVAELSGLYPDIIEFTIKAKGYMPIEQQIYGVAGTIKEKTITMHRGHRVMINVLSPDGKNVSDAHVYFFSKLNIFNFTKDNNGISSSTDLNGNARFETVATDVYQVVVTHDKYGTLTSEFEVENSEIKIIIQFESGIRVKGLVVDKKNIFQSSTRITLYQADVTPNLQTISTNSDGEFHFVNLHAGKWKLKASKKGFIDAFVNFTLEENDTEIQLKIILKVGKTITGIVLDQNDKPISNLRITCLPEFTEMVLNTQSSPVLDITDKNGEFRCMGLEDKKYKIVSSDLIMRITKEKEHKIRNSFNLFFKSQSYNPGDHTVLKYDSNTGILYPSKN